MQDTVLRQPPETSRKSDAVKSRDTLIWSAGLTFCLLLTALVSSVALLMFAVHSIDESQAGYETKLVQRNIDRSLNRVARDMVSGTTWDEAYEKTRGKIDQAWIEREWGVYFHAYFGHDLTVAIDPAGQPFYAASEGKGAPVGDYAGFVGAARPLLTTVSTTERRVRFDTQGDRQVGLPATASATGIVPWNGALYLTAVTNVTPETDKVRLDAAPDVMLISAKRVTPEFLASMQDSLGLQSLTLNGTKTGRMQAVTLRDLRDRPAGQLVWTPGDPARGVLWRFSALIAAGLLVLGAASAALMMRVKGMVTRLLAKDAALNDALTDLTAARDAAEAANDAKSTFIANISHEIRTPLNGLIGMTQVMGAHPLDPDQAVRLKVLGDSAMTLLALLNDVLDMAKIEAGRLEIVPAPSNLQTLIESACRPFAEMAAAKGLTFDLDIAPELSQQRMVDALRVRQILVNLSSNAVKFTDAGGVRIEARATAEGVRLDCVDTGVGMAAERLPELFSKFSQIDPSDTRRSTGAGLGLALSRELAQRMDGDLTVQSVLGEGSTFTLTIPAALVEPKTGAAAAAVQPATAARTGLRVLAAEDHAVNRMVLEALLAPRGIALTLVHDGAQAVEAYKTGNFDLVLMDIQMPVMSGVEASRAIRDYEIESGRPRTPILAVTANVLNHQRAAYAGAGIDDCIAKPIGATRLHQAIDDAMAGVTADAADTTTAARDPEPPRDTFKKLG